jgi:hypothetical protein
VQNEICGDKTLRFYKFKNFYSFIIVNFHRLNTQMRKMSFLFIAVIFCSCGLSKNKQKGGDLFYSDVDIFEMKGKTLLNEDRPTPPYFEIDSIDANKVRLTNWYPKIGNSSLVYIKQGNYWTAHFPLFSDTSNLVVYNYIGEGRFLSLEYLKDSSEDKLKTIEIWSDSIEIFYRFRTYLKISPSGDIDLLNKFSGDELQEKTTSEFHRLNGRLEVIRTAVAMPLNTIVRDTSYFNIGDHSIFWWREFGR